MADAQPNSGGLVVNPPGMAKKKKGKEAKDGLRRKGTSDAVSGETKVLSSHEGDEDEEEEEAESDSPLKGRRRKGRPPQTRRRRRPR